MGMIYEYIYICIYGPYGSDIILLYLNLLVTGMIIKNLDWDRPKPHISISNNWYTSQRLIIHGKHHAVLAFGACGLAQVIMELLSSHQCLIIVRFINHYVTTSYHGVGSGCLITTMTFAAKHKDAAAPLKWLCSEAFDSCWGGRLCIIFHSGEKTRTITQHCPTTVKHHKLFSMFHQYRPAWTVHDSNSKVIWNMINHN